MADIFISYASNDIDRVSVIAASLEASGFSVWWDQNLQGGARYSKVIEEEIRAASKVLVVWTSASIESEWVADEAELARNEAKLIPVSLDGSSPPLGFRQIQAIDFGTWRGNVEDAVFGQLLQSIREEQPVRAAPARTPTSNSIDTRKILVGALGLVIAIGFLLVLKTFAPSDQTPNQNVQSDSTQIVLAPERSFDTRSTIVVLPFINMSGDPEQEYFSDGITEDLIVTLHSYRLFPIIARTSSFTYKDTAKDIPTIAAELGASYLLTGTVRRTRDNIRISVELLDATGRNLWANRFDVPLANTYSVQDQIVASIVSEIDSEILVNEADLSRHVRPADMNAWDYYLQARSLTTASLGFMDINGQPVTVENTERAKELLHKAIALEPDFAAAYSLLMHADGAYMGQLGIYVSEEFRAAAFERSMEYAKIARRLNPFEALACSCQALMLQMTGKNDEALRIQEEALRELPTNTVIHAALAKILESDRQFDRALIEIQTAKRLSPRDIEMSTYDYFESAIHLGMGNFDQALISTDDALSLSPGLLDAHAIRIMALYVLGKKTSAQTALHELEVRIPEFTPAGIWPGPLHPAVENRLPPEMKSSINGEGMRTAFRHIIVDLGWDEGGA